MRTVYFDYNATTPLDPQVREAMLPFLGEVWGNPSSVHHVGRRARALLDDSRDRAAKVLGCKPSEVIFTSGGTESANLAIFGTARRLKSKGRHILTSAIEHHAVLHCCEYLAKNEGFEVNYLPVDQAGVICPDSLARAIRPDTILVSVMAANNEVGTVQPIAAIAERVHRHRGVLFHADAVQAAPWLPLDVEALGVDLLSIAGHKLGGPRGVGALYIRRGTHIVAQQHGGSQERHRRAGTEDVAGAVGLATALELAVREMGTAVPRVAGLRDRLVASVTGPGVTVTGHRTDRLPHIASFVVADAEGGTITTILDLEGLACSTGSACATGSAEVSHVLTAMGYPEAEARGAVRLSVGRATTDADVDRAIALLPPAIERARAAHAASAGPDGTATDAAPRPAALP